MRALPEAKHLLGVALFPLATTACASDPSEAEAEALPWVLADASQGQIVTGLRTCLAELGIEDAGVPDIANSGWTGTRRAPPTVDDPEQTIFHVNPTSPVLLVHRPSTEKLETCAVIFSADYDVSIHAVDAIGEDFAANRFQTPHGWMWTVGNVHINNDYHNGYRFEPAVFADDAFFSGYNDIRVYKCKEAC